MPSIHRTILTAVITVGLAAPAFAGSVDKVIITIDKTVEHETDSPRPSKRPGKAIQAPSGDMDSHFIRSDEYFTSLKPLKGGASADVQIAKMVTPASDASKGEAQFMDSYKGSEFWTRNFWKTRPATPEDLKIGTAVIYWGRYAKNHVYFAPRNEKEARNVSWRLAKITDTSDLFKGEVTVAGNKRVAVDSIRVME
ncbi:hypothetical protein SAMN02745119_03297 [Trichlorobacter thiogenes]|uniref:Uncharacterized protein n=1 Tax=Trichlorobacter thiogenes TaxID=115783 RepID=A0A1T4S6R4_9BACT|nr:hypothetical protein [Trichlorobacter thiogenes]SKA23925.1 hypothetical protein SAMN02745119_03297 [Trichlorobacter thiogenes]